MFSCNLHFWQNDWDLLHVTAITWGGTDTEISVSTESWPWRRKFCRCSCRDLNPWPFNHKSSTLTPELSLPQVAGTLWYKAEGTCVMCVHPVYLGQHPPLIVCRSAVGLQVHCVVTLRTRAHVLFAWPTSTWSNLTKLWAAGACWWSWRRAHGAHVSCLLEPVTAPDQIS